MARNSDKLRREDRTGVGYGRPPVQHRFQPGKSGNPRGRPKVSPDLTALAAKELSRKRWIIVDGKRISARTDEILIKKLIATGKIAAINLVFGWASQHHEKERRKKIEYKRATPDMSPQEAMECYISTMQQPAWYDDDFCGDLESKPEKSSRKKSGPASAAS
jgi:hypothetical protein